VTLQSRAFVRATRICQFFTALDSKFAANFASALAIELRRGSLPDNRDFLRFKFKNGTDADFQTLHVFSHNGDIPLTEFIYRIEVLIYLIISVAKCLRLPYFSECRDQL